MGKLLFFYVFLINLGGINLIVDFYFYLVKVLIQVFYVIIKKDLFWGMDLVIFISIDFFVFVILWFFGCFWEFFVFEIYVWLRLCFWGEGE